MVFEQKDAGYGNLGTDLRAIDFVAFASACGAKGFACREPEEVGSAILAALRQPALQSSTRLSIQPNRR